MSAPRSWAPGEVDGFPGASRYTAFVESAAADAAARMEAEYREGKGEPVPAVLAELVESYTVNLLALLALAGDVVSGTGEGRGRSAALLFATMDSDLSPFTLTAERIAPHLDTLPVDPVADLLRGVVTVAATPEAERWECLGRATVRTATSAAQETLAAALGSGRGCR